VQDRGGKEGRDGRKREREAEMKRKGGKVGEREAEIRY
jgi:hypothetical protein